MSINHEYMNHENNLNQMNDVNQNNVIKNNENQKKKLQS